MKYKIIELNEDNLRKFGRKIIQVIDSRKEAVIVDRGPLGPTRDHYEWILTCLVEVE